MNEKPKTRDVKDAVVLKHGTRGWHQGLPRQGVQEARDEGWDAQGQPQGQVRREQEREQRDEQRGRPYRRPEMRAVMVDIIDAVMINMYEKPETRDVMDDITDAVMLKHGVRGWHQDPLRKGTQHVGEDRDEGWDAQDHCPGQVRQEQEREQRDEQEQHGRLDHRTEAVLLSV